MNYALECRALRVSFGTKTTLDGLDLKVRAGEMFGFLGPNGAGKSTTIKSLLGLIQPASGEVLVHGVSPDHPSARRRIGFLPEEAMYYRFLTPMEILRFYGDICGVERGLLTRRIEELLKLVGMWEVRNRQIKTFSKGMTQKISLAQALIHDPDTLILDEPTSGLDPIARMDLRSLLKDLRHQGKTIFFSSHELSEAELLCDTIAIIKNGKIIKTGSVESVLAGKEHNLERFFIDTIKNADGGAR
jgi:ABC-2 type transport system ATP-binding protein